MQISEEIYIVVKYTELTLLNKQAIQYIKGHLNVFVFMYLHFIFEII